MRKNLSFFMWPLMLGLSGFVAGFLGPIFFNSDANQGPLVGILITGPLGLILGFVFTLLARVLHLSAELQWKLLYVSCGTLVLVTLYFVQPEPKALGELVTLEFKQCSKPVTQIPRVTQYWQDRIAKVHWVSPREGWLNDLQSALKQDQGLVLTAKVLSQKTLYKNRKPWNFGTKFTRSQKSTREVESFYISESVLDCQKLNSKFETAYFIKQDTSVLTKANAEWPPREASRLLTLRVIQAVPAEYLSFL